MKRIFVATTLFAVWLCFYNSQLFAQEIANRCVDPVTKKTYITDTACPDSTQKDNWAVDRYDPNAHKNQIILKATSIKMDVMSKLNSPHIFGPRARRRAIFDYRDFLANIIKDFGIDSEEGVWATNEIDFIDQFDPELAEMREIRHQRIREMQKQTQEISQQALIEELQYQIEQQEDEIKEKERELKNKQEEIERLERRLIEAESKECILF